MPLMRPSADHHPWQPIGALAPTPVCLAPHVHTQEPLHRPPNDTTTVATLPRHELPRPTCSGQPIGALATILTLAPFLMRPMRHPHPAATRQAPQHPRHTASPHPVHPSPLWMCPTPFDVTHASSTCPMHPRHAPCVLDMPQPSPDMAPLAGPPTALRLRPHCAPMSDSPPWRSNYVHVMPPCWTGQPPTALHAPTRADVPPPH